MNPLKKSLRGKIILIFVLAGFASLALLGGVIYSLVLSREMSDIRSNLSETANFVAQSVDAQVHRDFDTGDEGTDEYQKMITAMRAYREVSGLTYLYTLRAYTDKNVQFVLDTDDSSEQAMIGDLYPNQAEIMKAFSGEATITSKPITDDWGTFITAFAPILDDAGKVIAIVGADMDIQNINELKSRLLTVILIGLFCGAAVMVFVSLLISASISKPIISLMQAMRQAENGDLHTRAPVASVDELGQLTQSFNRLMEKTGQTMQTIHVTMDSLRDSSAEMTGVADTMVACSEETSNKTTAGAEWAADVSSTISQLDSAISHSEKFVFTVADSVEQMSQTVKGLAKAADMTAEEVRNSALLVEGITENIANSVESARNVSGNVNDVVTAVKEINLSLNDVGKNCSRSMVITKNAKSKTDETNIVIEELNTSAKSISRMVSTIRGIAEKTNMLALNAAIEAAGAGEAGKGFAVVANEVKELAKQTSVATEDISHKIGDMNRQMDVAVRAVLAITTVVDEVDEINNTIASAVTEQSAITNAISHAAVNAAEKVANIGHEIGDIHEKAKHVANSSDKASQAVQSIAKSTIDFSNSAKDAAKSIEETAIGIRQIAEMSHSISGGAADIRRTMEDINASSEEVTAGSEETQNAAIKLNDLAKQLGRLLSQFRL